MLLTGRKLKSLQIEQLRTMGIPFWVNAVNAPVVSRSAIEGRAEATTPAKPKWSSNAVRESQ